MKKGHIGKVLEVNLSTKQVTTADLEKKVIRDFLGGLGLGIKILYSEVGPSVDALSPDNVVIFAPGPLRRREKIGFYNHNIS
jgi:aldehyde:ferredoxin oxidoreductase